MKTNYLKQLKNEVEKVQNAKLSSLIEENISDEASARKGYYSLIEVFKQSNLEDKETAISIIEEIISDELNHTEKLKNLLTKYSNIEPAND